MARDKLTAIKCKNGEGKLFDGAGLYLVKRSVQSGRWVYRYKFNSRSRDMGLGPYPAVSLAEARKERDKWAGVLRGGDDPMEVKGRQRVELEAERNKDDPTFAQAAKITFEAKKPGLRGEGKAGRWLSPIRIHVLPHLGERRMSQIHQADIHKTLQPIWRKMHPTAEKAIQRMRIIFRHMQMSGVDCDPFTVDKAQHMLGEVNHQPVQTRATPWQDIPALWGKLSGDHPSHLALRFKMLTVVRSAAIRGARFDEIDGDVWTVPAERVKGREGQVSDFRVPLVPAALDIVERSRSFRRGPFVFQGPGGGGVSEKAINDAYATADPNGTPHGLRTSFRTWVQDTGGPYDVAETALGHIIGGKVERAYARSDLLERRRVLLGAWARYATGEIENVVHLASGGF